MSNPSVRNGPRKFLLGCKSVPFAIPTKANVHLICSGYATFSTDQRSILVSNLVNGVDAYVISAVSPVLQHARSFPHPIRCNVPLLITSALQGAWIIGGSDDGTVRIFDQRSGDLVKCLQHADGM
jgi:hypothetical protein